MNDGKSENSDTIEEQKPTEQETTQNITENTSSGLTEDSIDEPHDVTHIEIHDEDDQPAETEKTSGMFTRKKVMLFAAIGLVLIGVAGGIMMLTKDEPAKTTTKSVQQVPKKLGVAVGLTEGLVQYSSDAKNWQDLKADTDLSEGDSVRTATNGRVVLLIDDGSAVRLDLNSEVKLSNLTVDSILVTNTSGAIYSRVVASTSRTYTVAVGKETYKAKGTAYRTFNEANKVGVEVFHSTVQAVTTDKVIPEGSYLFSKHEQTDKQGSILALSVEALKTDSFIQWNSVQDKKVAIYADKLGILGELDKPAPAPAPAPAPTTATNGITLSGYKSEYSAVFSWKVVGVDTSKGYKLVRSSKTTLPTYPDNTVAYLEAGKTSYSLYVGEATTYNYRICAYRESSCASYSNSVSITTLAKAKETVMPGAVSLSSAGGGALNWTIQGTAPYGYKVVVGTSSGPTYENNYKKYYTGALNLQIPSYDVTAGTPYYIKVCKYTESGCTDYSNEINYTP